MLRMGQVMRKKIRRNFHHIGKEEGKSGDYFVHMTDLE